MKKIFKLLVGFILLTLFFGCNEEGRKSFFEKNDFSGELSKLVLNLSKDKITPNNSDEVIITYSMLNKFDEIIRIEGAQILIDNYPLSGNKFKTSKSGTYRVVVELNGIRSQELTITAKDSITNFKFDNVDLINFRETEYGYKLNDENYSKKEIKLTVNTTDNKYFVDI